MHSAINWRMRLRGRALIVRTASREFAPEGSRTRPRSSGWLTTIAGTESEDTARSQRCGKGGDIARAVGSSLRRPVRTPGRYYRGMTETSEVERDRLGGRSRPEQQPPLFRAIRIWPKDRLRIPPAGWKCSQWHHSGHDRVLVGRKGILRSGQNHRADAACTRRMGQRHAALHGTNSVPSIGEFARQTISDIGRRRPRHHHGKEPPQAFRSGDLVP